MQRCDAHTDSRTSSTVALSDVSSTVQPFHVYTCSQVSLHRVSQCSACQSTCLYITVQISEGARVSATVGRHCNCAHSTHSAVPARFLSGSAPQPQDMPFWKGAMILTASFCPLMLSCSPSASSVPKISACPSTSCTVRVDQLCSESPGRQKVMGHSLSAGHDCVIGEVSCRLSCWRVLIIRVASMFLTSARGN